jgi:chorismate-pyruvate lyase
MLPALLLMAPAPIDAFEAMLSAHDSATLALTQWCGERKIAPDPRITATLVKGEDALAAPDLSDTLGTEDPGYRHVRLACGDQVLSEAHNWYNPTLLTPEMNHLLATTDTPFGKAVAALNFRREKLASRRGPLPGCPAQTILANRALLRLPDGRVLALVLECYTKANLGTHQAAAAR